MSSYFIRSPAPEGQEDAPSPPLESSTRATDDPASLDVQMAKLLRQMQLSYELQQLQQKAELIQKPPTPVMGDLVLCNKVYEPWTGGKPKSDWSGLTEDSSRVPLPTQLRPIGSKAAPSMIKRLPFGCQKASWGVQNWLKS